MSVDRLGELLARWESLTEKGQLLTPEELCRDCPELLEPLREHMKLGRTQPMKESTHAEDTVNHVRSSVAKLLQDAAWGSKRAVTVPGYEILGELGRGGMGVVYKARQTSLGRLVALKMILAGAHAGPHHRARFRAEAEAAARLQHPNIVQVYEVGECDGCPFIALEFVDGRDLGHFIAAGVPKPAEAAELMETLARAVDYANRRGIVHRDLKPANILLTSDGSPRIADFGLAKRLDDDSGGTKTGDIIGTPSYMAPEQASGRSRDVGPATDVYALGTILYELLTAAPPFAGVSTWDTVSKVLNSEPEAPSRRNPGIPHDLETICLKCLEKEPSKRYASALALADDLSRFRAGEPVWARPVGALERGAKWVRRRPALAGLLATSAASSWLCSSVVGSRQLACTRGTAISSRPMANFRLSMPPTIAPSSISTSPTGCTTSKTRTTWARSSGSPGRTRWRTTSRVGRPTASA